MSNAVMENLTGVTAVTKSNNTRNLADASLNTAQTALMVVVGLFLVNKLYS